MHVDHLHREIFHAESWEFRPLCDKSKYQFQKLMHPMEVLNLTPPSKKGNILLQECKLECIQERHNVTPPNQNGKQEGLDGLVSLTWLPDEFRVWLFGSRKNFNIDFHNGGHLGFQFRIILATFHLQVTSILPMKFRVNWPFGSE